MIAISRSTGQVIHMDKLPPEQNQKAWEMILKAHVQLHPELLETQKEVQHERGN